MKMNKSRTVKKKQSAEPKQKIDPEKLVDSVSVKLLSRGIPYDGVGDSVIMQLPKFKATKYLATINADNFESNLSSMLSLLLVEPDIDPWKLTAGDRNWLLLWTRMQIHSMYHFSITCPHCLFPNSAHNYPLKNVPCVVIDKECSGETEVELEQSKSKVKLGFVTGEDEKEVDRVHTQTEEKREILRGVSAIREIDGRSGLTLEDKMKWMDNLPPGDEITILGSWQKFTQHGPNYGNCPYTCPKCGKVSRIRLPFRPELWYPTIPFERAFGNAADSSDVSGGRDLSGDAGGGSDGHS